MCSEQHHARLTAEKTLAWKCLLEVTERGWDFGQAAQGLASGTKCTGLPPELGNQGTQCVLTQYFVCQHFKIPDGQNSNSFKQASWDSPRWPHLNPSPGL